MSGLNNQRPGVLRRSGPTVRRASTPPHGAAALRLPMLSSSVATGCLIAVLLVVRAIDAHAAPVTASVGASVAAAVAVANGTTAAAVDATLPAPQPAAAALSAPVLSPRGAVHADRSGGAFLARRGLLADQHTEGSTFDVPALRPRTVTMRKPIASIDAKNNATTNNATANNATTNNVLKPSERDNGPASLSVTDEPLSSVFRAVASRLGQPVTVSQKAARYKVSGRFDLAEPMALIESLSRELGLIWYFDGRVVYVYDHAEAKTMMYTMPAGMLDELRAFLKSAALYDPQYPFSATRDKGAVYLSGPPKYVDIVSTAVEMLKQKAKQVRVDSVQQDETGRKLEMIKLRHTMVSDRTYRVRGEQTRIPGMATVLQWALAQTSISSSVPGGVQVQPPAAGSRLDGAALSLASTGAANLSAGTGPGNTFELPKPSFAKDVPGIGDFSRQFDVDLKRGALSVSPVRVIPYADTNSLLVDGTPTQIAAIKSLVATLDTPKAQIEMSLWVIDISKDDAQNLGTKLGATIKGAKFLDLSMNLGAAAATISKAQTTKLIAEITALSSQNRAQVVSRPILLTQDNVPAVFDNSHTYYVKLEGYQATSLEKVTYGTMINVLPRVASEQGRIEMTLDIEDGKTSSPSANSGLTLPPVNRTQISTVARVMHEQSLLVGGYTVDDGGDEISKVPLLGDIPYIGALFRYKSDKRHKSIRMFLIQPKVLAEDAAFEGADDLNSNPIIDNAVDALRRRLEDGYGRHSAR